MFCTVVFTALESRSKNYLSESGTGRDGRSGLAKNSGRDSRDKKFARDGSSGATLLPALEGYSRVQIPNLSSV